MQQGVRHTAGMEAGEILTMAAPLWSPLCVTSIRWQPLSQKEKWRRGNKEGKAGAEAHH